MTHVVVVADRIDQDGLDLLSSGGDFAVVSTVDRPERLPEELRKAHALVVRSSTRVTRDTIALATELRVIARAGMGVDNIDVAAATEAGIAVLNTPGANTISAAEHTLALLLALLRNVPRAMSSLQSGQWDRKRFGGTELHGKTLSALGLGRIGQHVVRLAQAFGMRVLAVDRADVELPGFAVRWLSYALAPLTLFVRPYSGTRLGKASWAECAQVVHDWIAPPLQSHHTFAEVAGWAREAGLVNPEELPVPTGITAWRSEA